MGQAKQKQTGLPDDRIVELYWERSESAISVTADKYGDYCSYITGSTAYIIMVQAVLLLFINMENSP